MNFWNILAGIDREISLWNIALSVVIGFVLYKFSPFVAKFLVAIAVRARGSKKVNTRERNKRLKTLADMFTTVLKVLIVLVVAFQILNDFRVDLVPLFASAGVAGVALGFGAQSIIKDLLAGFFIILENQYRVGDFIDVSGIGIPSGDAATSTGGTVEKISLRSTKLRDRNGNVHFIPNGAIVQVINKTLGYSKVHFVLGVATGTDMDKLADIINQAGREMISDPKWKDKIIDAPHFSEIGAIGADGFNVTVNGITEPAAQWTVSSEFRKRILEKMQKHGISTIETVS